MDWQLVKNRTLHTTVSAPHHGFINIIENHTAIPMAKRNIGQPIVLVDSRHESNWHIKARSAIRENAFWRISG